MVNGIRHWVRVVGELGAATPLVVVHGGPGGFVYDFERLTGPALERLGPVVYYEQRGSGRSDSPYDGKYSIELLVDDLEQLRRELRIERMVLLGISFGGDLAAEFAVVHPERVDGLILQGTGLAERSRPSPWPSGFEAVAADDAMRTAIRVAVERSGPSAVWDVVDRETTDRFLFHQPAVAQRIRELWAESGLVNTGAMSAALAEEPVRAVSLVDELAELDLPVLVLIGLWDRNAGVDGPRDLVTRLPRAELHVFENSAHFPNAEETDRYVNKIARFLAVP
ncbi:alpha/beta fold hydrolase [Kribbella jejuensis]|uniref:Proline iminopeptidase n=1 Tax=Kribbella jejuensis TaxID=236068 RepID=A0A542EV71_9ACTN|nr:proline iminopeptidase [Kribbella jejuensis]